MTGGDNNVSNVKMHSSQRNGHPTKRKKLTDQTAHSCPSQTDGSKKKKKERRRTPDWFSVAVLRSLNWHTPHSLSQTKGTDKKQAWQQQHLWGQSRGRGGYGGERALEKKAEKEERAGGWVGRGWWRYSRMVKSITWDAKQKTGCSYISLLFPIKKDWGMQEAGVRGGKDGGQRLMGRGLSRWKRHSAGQEAR